MIMPKTLERPKQAKSTQPKTPFTPRLQWAVIPSVPSRERCQQEVLPAEREEGAEIITQYRAAEALAATHDVDGRLHAIHEAENGRLRDLRKAYQLRNELRSCSQEEFNKAIGRLSELRVQASELAKTILSRLLKAFDSELTEAAIAAETRLDAIGVPVHGGPGWTLSTDPELTTRHVHREIVRAKLAAIDSGNSIGATEYFCSDEQGVPFEWL
jgi:hypothetical protein